MSTRHSYLACVVVALAGCTMDQDLGRDDRTTTLGDPGQAVTDDHAGFGAGWACPANGEIPLTRELACPLTKPISGDACAFASSAPCTFDGATAVCLCMSNNRWSCLEKISFRTLKVLPEDGEPCSSAIEISTGTITCNCVDGAYRCRR